MFRIYFEAGARALADYDHKHAILTDLSNSYSSSIDDFPAKLRVQEEKLAEVKDQLYHIKKALENKECAALEARLQEEPDTPLLVWTLEDLSLDDAFDMAKRYMKTAPKLLLLSWCGNTLPSIKARAAETTSPPGRSSQAKRTRCCSQTCSRNISGK